MLMSNFTLGDILKNLQQFSQHPYTMNEAIIPSPNQLAPVAPTPQPQPVNPMPALPASLASGGKPQGLGGTLGGMAKNFLGTAAEALPPALANYALFGDTEMGHRMTINSVVNQLEKKKMDEEERKNNMMGDVASYWWSMRKYGRDKGLKDDDIDMAILSEQLTGIPEIDEQIKQGQGTLKPLIESGKFGAGDIWNTRVKLAEYDKLLKDEEKKYQYIPGSEGQYVDPEHPEKGAIALPGFQAKKEQSKLLSPEVYKQRVDLAGDEQAARAKYRKPDKPETVNYQNTWIYSEDGTKRVPARFNPKTGTKEPLSKKWQKVPKGKETAANSIENELNLSDETLPEEKTTKKTLKAGDIEDGYKFMGGNPADPKNWKKVK